MTGQKVKPNMADMEALVNSMLITGTITAKQKVPALYAVRR